MREREREKNDAERRGNNNTVIYIPATNIQRHSKAMMGEGRRKGGGRNGSGRQERGGYWR